MIGEEGSFWADPNSLELLRMDSRAVEIPFSLPLDRLEFSIEYAPTRIGELGRGLAGDLETVDVVRDHGAVARELVGPFRDRLGRNEARPGQHVRPPRQVVSKADVHERDSRCVHVADGDPSKRSRASSLRASFRFVAPVR